ncbi:MAG: DUF2892 domain-containing protein [Bacilli bacterium]|nr:DUF2892 domain-containing protein [Bacilli bacterium]
MEKNVGKNDSYLRYSIGIVLLVVAYILSSWWLVIPAVIAFATGFFGVCGLYKIFGINTCKIKTK